MRFLVLVISVFVFLGGVKEVVAQVVPTLPPVEVTSPPASTTPAPSTSPDPSPSQSAAPTVSPGPTASVEPSTTPVPSASQIPASATPQPSQSAQPTTSPSAATSPSTSPAVGGAVSSPAPSVGVDNSPTPAPVKKVVSTVVNSIDKTTTPVIKDIGDNAINTLLETPLSVFIPQNPKNVYRVHGLSQSSTSFLLFSSFLLFIIGLSVLHSQSVAGLFGVMRRRFGSFKNRSLSVFHKEALTPPNTPLKRTRVPRKRMVVKDL
jgi:hypothetical protein